MRSLFNNNPTGQNKAKLNDVDVVNVYCDNYQKQINFLRRTLNDFINSVLICKVLKTENNRFIENEKTIKLVILKNELKIANGTYLSTAIFRKKTYIFAL